MSSTGTRAAPDPGAKEDSESRSVCLSGDLSSVDGQGVSLKDEDQLGIFNNAWRTLGCRLIDGDTFSTPASFPNELHLCPNHNQDIWGALFPSGLGLSSQLDLECVLEGAPGYGQVNRVLCGPGWPLACYPSALNHAPRRTACNLTFLI